MTKNENELEASDNTGNKMISHSNILNTNTEFLNLELQRERELLKAEGKKLTESDNFSKILKMQKDLNETIALHSKIAIEIAKLPKEIPKKVSSNVELDDLEL